MEKFISCVRAEPCLWNPIHQEYREVLVRDAAWQRIVTQCNNDSIPNVKIARATWRKLRDNHREALKRAKLGHNKLLPAQITTWKYAKIMQFLEPHMKYRITETIEPDAAEESETKTPEQDVSTSHGGDPHASPPRKRRCQEHSIEPAARPHSDGDALHSFFNFMLKSTRDMPMWMQTQVKKKIFAVVIEAEEKLSSNEQHEPVSEECEAAIRTQHIKTEIFTEDSCDDFSYNT